MPATDLTSSQRDRQNILNNRYAVDKVEQNLALGGIQYIGDTLFTKQQVIEIFGISDSTIEKYLAQHDSELRANGYRVLKGKYLREFKGLPDVSVISYGNKTSALGVFNFRAVLNLAMLLTESERARIIRSRILDIVIDVMAERAGGRTKYINQRDQDYLPAAYQEFSYRQAFAAALNNYLDMGNFKYGVYTNKVYQAIFKENAHEYRKILNLAEKDNLRETLYAEVLRAVAVFESGLAEQLKQKSEQLERKLKPKELDALIDEAEKNPFLKPIIEDARTRMASRDLCFRDALHEKLESYIQHVPEADFERFLGETSRSLEERLADPETLEVFKRLKDR